VADSKPMIGLIGRGGGDGANRGDISSGGGGYDGGGRSAGFGVGGMAQVEPAGTDVIE
jgi:hypothetical protein